jgi:hypothetical protein
LEKIKIQLWRNSAERNWSVQVTDKRYDAVTLPFVQRFVTRRLADAKKSPVRRRQKTELDAVSCVGVTVQMVKSLP